MAVESRFVVIRHGVEAKTFMDKKSADEYDKMLDMADNLADVFSDSPIELSGSLCEELSIYLAQHRDDVLVALLAKKAVTKPTKKREVKVEGVIETNEQEVVDKTAKGTTVKNVKKTKVKPVKLNEAS
jgi:dsDNA-binding SOS-regulon protein